MEERPEEKAPDDGNDDENAQGNNVQAPANNQVYQWLHGINMAQYWASFQSNGCTFWGAVDLLCMNIIMVGHRRHILKELSKMNAQLSGSAILSGGSGGDAVGLGGAIGARGVVIGARGCNWCSCFYGSIRCFYAWSNICTYYSNLPWINIIKNTCKSGIDNRQSYVCADDV